VVVYRAYSSEKPIPRDDLEGNAPEEEPKAPSSESSTPKATPDAAPTRITNADEFLASPKPPELDLASEILDEMKFTGAKERAKEVLKSYRVLLKDTKTDVDLDEVMTLATTMPPNQDHWDGEKDRPKLISKRVPSDVLFSQSKCDFTLSKNEYLGARG
jgi:hypothetical protein